jgi:hypothetical protein
LSKWTALRISTTRGIHSEGVRPIIDITIGDRVHNDPSQIHLRSRSRKENKSKLFSLRFLAFNQSICGFKLLF